MPKSKCELKLWHWYARAGEIDGRWYTVLLARIQERRDPNMVVDKDGCCEWARDEVLVGPIAGPGEPPSAPKDREDAERMAARWKLHALARSAPHPVAGVVALNNPTAQPDRPEQGERPILSSEPANH